MDPSKNQKCELEYKLQKLAEKINALARATRNLRQVMNMFRLGGQSLINSYNINLNQYGQSNAIVGLQTQLIILMCILDLIWKIQHNQLPRSHHRTNN
jgi:hypothetical protein